MGGEYERCLYSDRGAVRGALEDDERGRCWDGRKEPLFGALFLGITGPVDFPSSCIPSSSITFNWASAPTSCYYTQWLSVSINPSAPSRRITHYLAFPAGRGEVELEKRDPRRLTPSCRKYDITRNSNILVSF